MRLLEGEAGRVDADQRDGEVPPVPGFAEHRDARPRRRPRHGDALRVDVAVPLPVLPRLGGARLAHRAASEEHAAHIVALVGGLSDGVHAVATAVATGQRAAVGVTRDLSLPAI